MRWTIAILLAFVSNICLAATLDVSWQAVGSPGFIKIDGQGGKAECQLDAQGLGECSCALDAFKTGIDLRDHHMREKYLQTDKWPKASLKIASAAAGAFAGDLTLKGKTHPVKGAYELKDGAVEATFQVALDDYDVGVPSYLGVTVAKGVTVKVSGRVK